MVLFADDRHTPPGDLTLTLPANTKRVLATGLQPGAAYTTTITGTQLTIRAAADATRHADSGGVLDAPIS